jgi:acetoin utilization deacetylase AcuC-like enzyme
MFNNVAIAARYLLQSAGLERVAIVDWDVHHGNATQHAFEEDARVLFISLHGHPDTLYPGTGYAEERGRGAGEGTTINLPMMPGSGEAAYRQAFAATVVPALDAYRPQFLLISAGFDAHRADPLADIRLESESFAWMTDDLTSLAARHCGGRVVSVLEGGYNLQALCESASIHVQQLLACPGRL